MRLASKITIKVAGESIELRPSLRHAIRLERREGSFSQLVRDIQDGSLSAAVEIIADHTNLPFLQNRVFDVLSQLQGPLLEYVSACAGIDPEDAPANTDEKSERKSVPFADYLTQLYQIGTGWLGWTPKDTLDATPAEIMLAYKGRTEMLNAIFGSGEDETPATDDRPLAEKFRSIFAAHGTVREDA